MKPQAAVLLERLMGLVAGSPREILLLVLDAILSTLAVGFRAAHLRRERARLSSLLAQPSRGRRTGYRAGYGSWTPPWCPVSSTIWARSR